MEEVYGGLCHPSMYSEIIACGPIFFALAAHN